MRIRVNRLNSDVVFVRRLAPKDTMKDLIQYLMRLDTYRTELAQMVKAPDSDVLSYPSYYIGNIEYIFDNLKNYGIGSPSIFEGDLNIIRDALVNKNANKAREGLAMIDIHIKYAMNMIADRLLSLIDQSCS